MSRPLDVRRFSSEKGRLARPRPSEAIRSRTAPSKAPRKVVSMSRYGLVGDTAVTGITFPSSPAVAAAAAPPAPAPASIPTIAQRFKPLGGIGTRAGAGAATGTHCTKPCTATGVTHDWAQSEDTTPSGVLTATFTPGDVLMTALPS